MIPGGSEPVDTENVYGGTPPAAVNRTGTIGAPAGDGVRTGARIVSRAVDVTVRVRRPVILAKSALSATSTENEYVPVAVGVPEITPVVRPIDSPGGRLPLATLHAYGAVPPDTVNAAVLYGVFSTAGGRGGTVIGSGPLVMMKVDTGATAPAPRPSFTAIENVNDPAAVGIPLNVPVAGSSVTPGGSAPVDTEKVYGRTPPEAVKLTGTIGAPAGEEGSAGAVIFRGTEDPTTSVRVGVTPIVSKLSIA